LYRFVALQLACRRYLLKPLILLYLVGECLSDACVEPFEVTVKLLDGQGNVSSKLDFKRVEVLGLLLLVESDFMELVHNLSCFLGDVVLLSVEERGAQRFRDVRI
jgi:hypothetical protein